jgi:hypothetical protein
VSDLVVAYLAARPDGADALAIGREALALQGPAAIVAEIAARVARAVPGIAESDGRFVLAGAPGRPPVPTFLVPDPSVVALEARATGRHPPLDQLLEVATIPVDRAARDRGFHAYVRPVRAVPDEVARARGVPPAALATGTELDEVIDMLALTLAGRIAVVYGSDTGAAWVVAALQDRGRGGPVEVLRLRPALTAANLVPARAGLAAAAAALGAPTPLVFDALTAARTLGLMTAEAVTRGIPLRPPVEPPFDFAGRDFDADTLAALPAEPGVYRFYGRDGGLLYVGKAHDLRARVASYFRPGRDLRRRAPELLERVHRLEVERTGSELAALLREQELIGELRPELNVQRQVGRRRSVVGDFALLLPAADPGEVDVLLIRNGQLADRTTASTRGVGMREVRRALKRVFFAARPTATEEDAGEAQIVASWLRDERAVRAHNVVELSGCGGVADAARRVRASLVDPDLFRERVRHL